MIAPPGRLLNLIGEFRDRDFETSFREHNVEFYRRVNLFIAVPITFAVVVFILNDRGAAAENVTLLIGRMVMVAACLVMVWLNFRTRDWRVTMALTCAMGALLFTFEVWVDYHRPVDFLLHIAIDVILVMYGYVVLPTVPSQLFFVTLYSAALFVMFQYHKQPAHDLAQVSVPVALVIANVVGLGVSILFQRSRRELYATAQMERAMREELERTRAEVRMLSDLVPMCASCKKVRDDSGYWDQVEVYLQEVSGSKVSHGLCPDCMRDALEVLDSVEAARD